MIESFTGAQVDADLSIRSLVSQELMHQAFPVQIVGCM